MSGRTKLLVGVSLALLVGLGVGIGAGFGIWGGETDEKTTPSTTTTTTTTTTNTTTTTTIVPIECPELETHVSHNDLGTFKAHHSPACGVNLLGVTFAKAKRFSKPEIFTYETEDVIDATSDGDSCFPFTYDRTDSEDCLNVNIYLPPGASEGKNLPVMVYLHGGAFYSGTNDIDRIRGDRLAAEQNVIVVEPNYRLHGFGFWTLDSPDEDGFVSNWGILDQRAALEWTNKYIAGFGGDPENINLSGCSAGGQSSFIHFTSKGSWGLFKNILSWSPPVGIPLYTVEKARQFYHEAAEKLGCLEEKDGKKVQNFECLRSLPAEEIKNSLELGPIIKDVVENDVVQHLEEPYAPLIDGIVIEKDVHPSIKAGHVKPNTKLYVGVTENESEEFLEDILWKEESRLPGLVLEDLDKPFFQYYDIRQARVPLKFYEEVIYNNLGFDKGDELLDVLGCRQKCQDAEVDVENFFLPRAPGDNLQELADAILQLIEDFNENRPWEARCDCSDEMERWLTSWSFFGHLRNALDHLDMEENKISAILEVARVAYPLGAPLRKYMKNCYESSCHCVTGEYYLFANEQVNTPVRNGWEGNGAIDPKDVAFGKSYRNVVGKFLREEEITELSEYDPSTHVWNIIRNGTGDCGDDFCVNQEKQFDSLINLYDEFDLWLEL